MEQSSTFVYLNGTVINIRVFKYGIHKYGIHKFSINGHKRTPGSNEQYGIQKYGTQISNKWPQENVWLKPAIMKTNIQ